MDKNNKAFEKDKCPTIPLWLVLSPVNFIIASSGAGGYSPGVGLSLSKTQAASRGRVPFAACLVRIGISVLVWGWGMGGAAKGVEFKAREQQHVPLHFMLLSGFRFAVPFAKYKVEGLSYVGNQSRGGEKPSIK